MTAVHHLRHPAVSLEPNPSSSTRLPAPPAGARDDAASRYLQAQSHDLPHRAEICLRKNARLATLLALVMGFILGRIVSR